MALIACPECKKKVSDTSENCPNCGYKFTIEEKEKIKRTDARATRETKKQETESAQACTPGKESPVRRGLRSRYCLA